MGGIADALGMGGPQAPDPYRTANAQGVANVEAARVTAGLNRPDQHTPYGSLTWKQGESTFDQAGYDKALAQYQQDLNAWNSRTTTPGADGGPAPQGNTYGEGLAGGALNQPRNIATGALALPPLLPTRRSLQLAGMTVGLRLSLSIHACRQLSMRSSRTKGLPPICRTQLWQT